MRDRAAALLLRIRRSRRRGRSGRADRRDFRVDRCVGSGGRHYHVEVNRNGGAFSPAWRLSSRTRASPASTATRSRSGSSGEPGGVMSPLRPSEIVRFVAATPGNCATVRDHRRAATTELRRTATAARPPPDESDLDCGVSDRDSDAADAATAGRCDADPAKTEPGSRLRRERPGRRGRHAGLPANADPAKTVPGICGCGVSDGTATRTDRTATAATPIRPDRARSCGCGVSEVGTTAVCTAATRSGGRLRRCARSVRRPGRNAVCDSCDSEPATTRDARPSATACATCAEAATTIRTSRARDCGCGESDVDTEPNGTADCHEDAARAIRPSCSISTATDARSC